jgi:hypothetical protein
MYEEEAKKSPGTVNYKIRNGNTVVGQQVENLRIYNNRTVTV